VLATADLDGALAALGERGIAAERRGDRIHAEVDPADAARLNHAMAAAGHWLTELRPDEASLEDVFLRLTAAERSEDHHVEGAAERADDHHAEGEADR
jgi:hypothetical protein